MFDDVAWRFDNKDKKREYDQKYYKRSDVKARRRTRRQKYQAAIRTWVNRLKTELGCGRCSEIDFRCLDFHHRDRTQKRFGVSRAVQHCASRETIQIEIDKCDLLCSNCHRKEHYDETSAF